MLPVVFTGFSQWPYVQNEDDFFEDLADVPGALLELGGVDASRLELVFEEQTHWRVEFVQRHA